MVPVTLELCREGGANDRAYCSDLVPFNLDQIATISQNEDLWDHLVMTENGKASIEQLQKMILTFRDERDWKQFHNPKDVSLSLVLEAAELMEHFQWKNAAEMDAYIKKNKTAIAEEVADVLYWVLLISRDLNIDLADALKNKIKKNERKYPVAKSKGKHTKYTRL